MKTISAGYEFAHRDDYEGRHVLPNLKVDADCRNIEEIEVEPDETRASSRGKSDEEMKAWKESGFKFKDYDGMIPEMERTPWSSTTSTSTRRRSWWKC